MAHLFGPISGHHFLAWIETKEGLIALDTGWDVADGKPYEGSDLEAIALASEQSNHPLTHLLLTHDHWDHCAHLTLLRQRWPMVKVYAHANSSAEGVTISLQGGEALEINGMKIQAIETPGHSAHRDELCYYLPELRFLFTGDVAQPQGPSYSFANGHSPVPYFHFGEAYQHSLKGLLALDVQYIRSGHGDFLAPEQAKQWLRVTLATVIRMEELAIELVDRYPNKDENWLADVMYDQIASERHFGLRAAALRKRKSTYPPDTDYERFDKPGLLWAIRQAKMSE